MPFADRRTWEKIRPMEVQDTGLGEACDLWAAACRDMESVAGSPDRLKAAQAAFTAMEKALAKVEGKAKKIVLKKKRSEVEALVKEWRAGLADYQEELAGAAAAVEGRGATGLRQRALEAVQAAYDHEMKTLEDHIAPGLQEAAALLKAENLGEAEAKLKGLSVLFSITEDAFQEPDAFIAEKLKPFKDLPKDAVTTDDLAAVIRKGKTLLDKQVVAHGKLLALATQAIGDSAPESSMHRKEYLACEKKAADTLKDMKGRLLPDAERLLKQCEALQSKQVGAIGPEKVLPVVDKMIKAMREIETDWSGPWMDATTEISAFIRGAKWLEQKWKDNLQKSSDALQPLSHELATCLGKSRIAIRGILTALGDNSPEAKRLMKYVAA